MIYKHWPWPAKDAKAGVLHYLAWAACSQTARKPGVQGFRVGSGLKCPKTQESRVLQNPAAGVDIWQLGIDGADIRLELRLLHDLLLSKYTVL